jgi:hypothetical protein
MLDSPSGYHFFSFGLVLKDKADNTDLIEVLPIEKISVGSGIIQDMKVETNDKVNIKQKYENKLLKEEKLTYTVTTKNHQGIDKTESVTGALAIVAKWTSLGDANRMTAPDVIEGETVQILRVADSDQYFWVTIGREPLIRRLETVCYMYGNLSSGQRKIPWDKTSSYWTEVSTKEKHVKLHTSQSDGEAFGYDVEINTGQSFFSVEDTAGNQLKLDSANDEIMIKLTAGASIRLKGNTITFTGELITSDSKQTVINGKSINVNGGDIVLESDTGTITANGEDLTTDLT